MKNGFCKVVVVAAAIAVSSCGGGRGGDDAADSDSVSVSASVGEAEVLSPDLAWKELSGPVESVVLFSSGAGGGQVNTADSLSFDQTGRLGSVCSYIMEGTRRRTLMSAVLRYDENGDGASDNAGDGMRLLVGRDGAGRIVRYVYERADGGESDGAYSEQYSYDEQGRVASVTLSGWEFFSRTVYGYDERGRIVRAVVESSGPGYESSERCDYEYVDEDSYGNWTRREVKVRIAERSDESEDESVESTADRTERRRIHYRR